MRCRDAGMTYPIIDFLAPTLEKSFERQHGPIE